jgi:hypothetical protein
VVSPEEADSPVGEELPGAGENLNSKSEILNHPASQRFGI